MAEEKIDAEQAYIDFQNQVKTDFKRQDYANISDPIFFKWQRGEATKDEWLTAVAEVNAKYESNIDYQAYLASIGENV